MNNELKFDNYFEMEKRTKIALDFYSKILHVDEYPIILTDSATFYDIYSGKDSDAINLIYNYYNVTLNTEYFKMPFWKLLDFLYKVQK